jgi:hypothetical protein
MTDTRSSALAFTRLFRINELAVATLLALGYLTLHGHVLAAAGFIWYAALYIVRT